MADMNLDLGIEGFEQRSNIKKLVVPPHLRRRVSCGINWVNDAMGGKGFTPSTCGMLTGTPGAGKTTFMLQIADCITGTGNVCLFNTGEESLYQVALTAERLKVTNGFIPGQDTYVPQLLNHADNIFEHDVKGQSVKLRNGTEQQKTLFILIDSLQTMDDGKYKDGTINANSSVRVATALTKYAKEKQDVVVIFIGQVTKSGEFAGKNTIKHMVDMHLHLYIDNDQRSETWGERIFTNFKNRFGFAGRTYVLGMDESGLWKKGQYHPDNPDTAAE